MTAKAIKNHVGARKEKPFKSTLFESAHLMLGVNCLEPGQEQKVHTHAGQDKFYLVQAGRGRFTIGDAQVDAGAGEVVWAAADVPHGVVNVSDERLVLVSGIAPWR